MDVSAFSQLGIGIATLAILWLVVKYFIEALSKKDDYIQKIVDNFSLTMNNHIDHETKAWESAKSSQDKTVTALTKLIKAICQLSEQKK